jgi:hypothetical protein
MLFYVLVAYVIFTPMKTLKWLSDYKYFIFYGIYPEIIRGWKKLHNCNNEELHNLYSLPIRIKSQGGCDVRGMRHAWEKRNAYRVLVGKPEGKRPLGKPRCKWEGNI